MTMPKNVAERGADGGRVHEYSVSPGEEVSTTVALGVADALGRDVEDLSPLGDVVDMDALDSLFVSTRPEARVEFEYGDCLVAVVRGETVRVVTPE